MFFLQKLNTQTVVSINIISFCLHILDISRFFFSILDIFAVVRESGDFSRQKCALRTIMQSLFRIYICQFIQRFPGFFT